MIIDGRALARDILARTALRSAALPHRPIVAAYLAQDPTAATKSYLKIKAKSAEAAGCEFVERTDPDFFETADAAIVQLPTTGEGTVLLERIPVEKDADVLSRASRAAFERGDEGALLPPVVGAVKYILESKGIDVREKKAVVVGEGFLVGKPVASWLSREGASVTTIVAGEPLEEALQSADIIVSGTGVPHLIKPTMLRGGVVLIDAGTSESKGELKGDADPECARLCALFTPVPGGVGPVAVACLFENAVALAERAIRS